jgi:hypothetical protein
MISIQDNPRFKKDCERYQRAIKECSDVTTKAELNSLYNQFLSVVKQVDTGLRILVSEGMLNSTQHQEMQNRLSSIRTQLENKIS